MQIPLDKTTDSKLSKAHRQSSCCHQSSTPTFSPNSIVSHHRMTTRYYYDPASNEVFLKPDYDLIAVARTPTRSAPATPELSYSPYSTPTTSLPTTPILRHSQRATQSSSPIASSKMTRPRIHQVRWAPSEGARDPLPDERSVLKDFTRHMTTCTICKHALDRSSGFFCSRGYGRFVDMSPYFFVSNGKPYSQLDMDKNIRTQVLLPLEFEPAARFLRHYENGFDPRPVPQQTVEERPRARSRPRSRDYDRSPPPVIITAAPSRRRSERERYYDEQRRRGYHEPRRERPIDDQLIMMPDGRIYMR